VIELFAIADAATPPPPAASPMWAVVTDGLMALCGEACDEPITAEVLWRHEEAVEALMSDRDLLPVRYGTRFRGEEALARAIADRRSELAATLARVRGAVELSVRVHVAGDAEPPAIPTTGTEYVRAKLRSGALREWVVRTVADPLGSLARASLRQPPRAESELLRAAYLVDRAAVERFGRRVAELQAANPALSLLCTGPWPPYSFAE
jgi:gas vesicle protein GvpL/GvpF